MCALFRNKYRIESIRYPGYDYSSPGKYFITICTKNKIRYFGKIENRKMILSEIGQIAEKFWLEIPGHFRNIKLDEFIIMPDHIHGIIIVQAPNLGASTNTLPKLGASTNAVQAPNLGASIYDHIIRTNTELNRIGKYIRENPEKFIGNSQNIQNSA